MASLGDGYLDRVREAARAGKSLARFIREAYTVTKLLPKRSSVQRGEAPQKEDGMSAVEVTINGVLYDKINRTTQNVVLVGEAFLTGLGVGGGPIIPPGRPPLRPPIDPDAHPEHPIVLPPTIPTEPPPDGGDKPPPDNSGGWGFVSEWSRWGYFPGPEDAQPKRR